MSGSEDDNHNVFASFNWIFTHQEKIERQEAYDGSLWINRESKIYPNYDIKTLKAMAEHGF